MAAFWKTHFLRRPGEQVSPRPDIECYEEGNISMGRGRARRTKREKAAMEGPTRKAGGRTLFLNPMPTQTTKRSQISRDDINDFTDMITDFNSSKADLNNFDSRANDFQDDCEFGYSDIGTVREASRAHDFNALTNDLSSTLADLQVQVDRT